LTQGSRYETLLGVDGAELALEDVLEQGIQALRDLLGDDWKVVRRTGAGPAGGRGADALVEVSSSGDAVYTELLVDLERRITPRRVEDVLLPKLALIRQVNTAMNLLVMAPWIAPRTQQMLREHGIGYLDLTGNISLRIPRPAIVIQTEGASREPRVGAARDEHRPTLAGPRAGRLIRLLADVAPPYRAAQVAEAADLNLPWVSRLLGHIEDQLLIRRDGRVITHVDWLNLLRARAETFELLRHNKYVGMLAPNGIAQVHHALRSLSPFESGGEHVIMTGPYAARAVAPLAAGGQLMLYVEGGPRSLDTVADQLGLLRVADSADVLLLRAHDKVVFERPRMVDGIDHVALSQLALDCLSGPGRMPAEGEAILEYMAETEQSWRLKRLPSL
jgi:hypothetical protein